MNNVLIENVEGVSILEEKKNRDALDGVFQTQGSLRKHSCHLPEQAGVELLCVARYDIWGCKKESNKTSTEQTCGHTDQNGKKYAQHHIQGQKDQHLGQGENKSNIHIHQCENIK